MYECSHKHSSMGKARMKQDEGKEDKGKKRGVSLDWSKADMKKEVHMPHYYTIEIQY